MNTLLVALGMILAGTGCTDDFLLSASALEISPNPAGPGDDMQATFFVSLNPTQRHTVMLFIDGEEHLRESSDEAPAIPVILQLGDASDLIAEYGTGEHAAHVEVRLEDSGRSARTQSFAFELEEPES